MNNEIKAGSFLDVNKPSALEMSSETSIEEPLGTRNGVRLKISELNESLEALDKLTYFFEDKLSIILLSSGALSGSVEGSPCRDGSSGLSEMIDDTRIKVDEISSRFKTCCQELICNPC